MSDSSPKVKILKVNSNYKGSNFGSFDSQGRNPKEARIPNANK